MVLPSYVGLVDRVDLNQNLRKFIHLRRELCPTPASLLNYERLTIS